MTALGPYREAALVVIDDRPKHRFRYVVTERLAPDDNVKCPCCHYALPDKWDERYFIWLGKYGRYLCTPFRRRLLRGSLWWARFCPLDGTHFHQLCVTCGANVVGGFTEVALQERAW